MVGYPLWFNDRIGVDVRHREQILSEHEARYGHSEMATVMAARCLVYDLPMAFFFATAGKEVREAVILSSRRWARWCGLPQSNRGWRS